MCVSFISTISFLPLLFRCIASTWRKCEWAANMKRECAIIIWFIYICIVLCCSFSIFQHKCAISFTQKKKTDSLNLMHSLFVGLIAFYKCGKDLSFMLWIIFLRAYISHPCMSIILSFANDRLKGSLSTLRCRNAQAHAQRRARARANT